MRNSEIKNVIIVCDYGYIAGGAEKIAQQTALALKVKGLNVLFFCAVAPIAKELTDNGIEVICLQQADILHEKNRLKAIFGGIDNKKAAKAFNEVLVRFSPEDTVIHVHTWTKAISSSIFPIAQKKNFQVFITVHEYFLICPNGGLLNFSKNRICEYKPLSWKCITCNCDARSYPQKLFRVIRQRKQNKNIRKCKNISYIFISEFSKKQFLKRYNRISEDRQFFLSNPIEFEENRARVTCENNEEYLFIGRVSEEKGIRIFCEAVTRANVKATVIGDGGLKEELQTKYPNIQFVGWKTKQEMKPYLEKARCLIFSSIWYETFGLTAMEVTAYGIPVLCSNLNAATDNIKEGVNGFIYQGDSVEALCQAIEKVKNMNDIEILSKSMFELFQPEKFTVDNYGGKLIKIFNKV